jgi:sec-independent protein translocase protein TatA
MPFNLGFGEILIVLLVALLVFGGRLPEVGRSLGKGLVSFKEGLKGIPEPEDDEEEAEDEQEEEKEEVAEEEGGEKGEDGATDEKGS